MRRLAHGDAARAQGYRVLVVDRVTFPSDTISTHLLHPMGVAALARWGLLDRLTATGCPAIHTYTFDFGPFTISGTPGTAHAPVAYCPRRTILDKLLVDAAGEAGAEIREGFIVEQLLREDERVVGIKGRSKTGSTVSERARVVAPDFAERVRRAKREAPFARAAVLNFFRKPYGPGWALVGDAGYNKDPITAQGITDAFRDAERCAIALDQTFSAARSFDEAMSEYQHARDEHVRPTYEFTCQLATLKPPSPEMQQLFAAIAGNQKAMNGFVQMNAGTVSPAEFLSPENIGAIMSVARP